MALKDIALEVGVSASTVSRVLNTENTSAASQDLKRRIWEVAKAQGYIPNHDARRLKKSSNTDLPESHSLYCVYACNPQETKGDPFFTKLLENIEREAFKHNYILKYTFSAAALESEADAPTLTPDKDNCLIILGRFKSDFLNQVKKRFKKVIYVGLNVLNVACDQIVCNSYEASQEGVRYLHSLNHTQIGYIGSDEARLDGYKKAMEKLSLPVNENLMVSDAYLSMEGGYRGMLSLLKKSPNVTAVFCANDMVSIGALRACKDRGIRIPEDISLLGLNDIENIQYTDPMLSSVHVPLDEMGKMAFNVLLNRIQGGHTSYIKVLFPFSIVKRGSCKKLI